MKFILLSDMHLVATNPVSRKDNLVETQMSKLEFVLKTARKEDAWIFQAGDFFNTPRSWTLLPDIIDLLKIYQIPTYCVYGQHDTYFYDETNRHRTNLGILEKSGLVKILDEQRTPFPPSLLVFGASFGQELTRIGKVEEIKNVGVCHAPIAEQALFPGHDFIDATKYLQKHKEYDLILCGDIHKAFKITIKGRTIVNTGPMVRKEASEYNMIHQPHFFIWDDSNNSFEKVIIPHKPADEVLDRTHLDRQKDFEEKMDGFVSDMIDEMAEEFENNAEDSATFSENLHRFIRKNSVSSEVRKIISDKMEKKG